MRVTRLKAVTKIKYDVFVDDKFAFVLYKGELSKYQIEEGAEITEPVMEDIKKNVILKRAKLRAMHLLNDMDRTEGQLRAKLKANHYTEDVIEEALSYVKSFGYINDLGYAKRFIEGKKDKKSRKELYALLGNKGLPQSVIEEAFEECYEADDSRSAIAELMRKRGYSPEAATEKDRQKMYGYLMRKGFSYEDIRQVIQVSGWNA